MENNTQDPRHPREILVDEIIGHMKEIEIHCPCGARPESLHTHPHVTGCPVDLVLEKMKKVKSMLVKNGHDPLEWDEQELFPDFPLVFDRDIPDYGDVMTIQSFREQCQDGSFIDYDGTGHYSNGEKMTTGKISSTEDFRDGVYNKNATHVVWFNR